MKSLTRNWFLGVAVLALLALPGSIQAKGKPSGGGGGSKDIPICVTVNDDVVNFDIISDGGGDYCDSKKDKITAIVGRNAGQFVLETNANLSPTGSSMTFFFPAGTMTQVFGPIGVDEYPGGFVPTNVWVMSARAQVGGEDGYVDLREMAPGDSAFIAIRIQMELDGQNKVDLNYGDVLWAPDDPNSHVLGGQLGTVVAGDIDEDGLTDSWTISGTTAWMNEVINNDFNNRIQIGEVEMTFSFIAIKK
jgi:hypothetical protein